MLMLLAGVFAVVNGANDGGAMLAASLKGPGLRAAAMVALLAVALVGVPLVLGTAVADTLTSGLVDAPPGARSQLLASGVIAAIVVVAVLSRSGLPTSLTLGLVGGIVGAGVGRGLPVVGGSVGRVVAIGLVAPAVGGVLARGLSKAVAATLSFGGASALRWVHRLAAAVQAVAYAANDGQKMVAVLVVSTAGVSLPSLVAVALLFAVGAATGVGAAAGTLGGGIARSGPREEITAQLAGSAAVLGSAAVGAPVSMTQAVSGGLVGTGLLLGLRQVRWRLAGELAVAWLLTLPAAGLVGAVIAWIVEVAA